MKLIKSSLLVIVFLIVAAPASQVFADEYSQAISVFKNSLAVQPFFDNSFGYAVFPTVGKGGIIVGAAFGNGQVYKQKKLSGKVSLSKITIGFQLGGQAFSEIIFLQDQRAYDEFTRGSFEFDASASAVAVTAGAQAKAGSQGATAGASAGPATGVQAEINYTKGVAVFVHTKGGLMYEAAIGGQKFEYTPL
ncbi:MAG: lipid-binding SYLF domain-containing protein [Desulfobacula sp.]|nr:lipid-binding SYLF domain-containing protein [Desulfobacula sp.]